jgi:cytosine/uracil/thiamine/allantoin permease
MAPHDTNTPKEARRHAFPLIGMAVLLIVVLVGFLWWVSKAAGLFGEAETQPAGGIQGENTETTD